MHSRLLISAAFLTVALLAFVSAGCSREGKLARHVERADRYFQEGRFDAAELEYRNALRIEPLHPPAISGLAVLYHDQGRIGGVYPFLSKARELDPNNLQVRVRMGVFLQGAGRPMEAMEEALYVLERQPNHPQATLLLADAAVQPEQIQRARERLQQLPAPNAAAVQVALAHLALHERNASAAHTAIEAALAADPQFAPAHLAQGSLAAAKGDLEAAESAFAKAAELSPLRSPIRIRHAQFCLQRGRADQGRKILEELTTKAADFVPAWVLLAHLEASERRYEQSLIAVGKALARDGANPEAMLISSRVRIATGEPAKAVAELERAAKLFPKAPQFLHQLALAQVASGELGKAASTLTSILQLNPDTPVAALLLAEINLRQGNHGQTIEAMQALVRQHPEIPQARLLLAQAYRTAGRGSDALHVYQDLQSAFPTNPEAPLLKGLLLLQQQDLRAAKAAFEEALKLDPQYLPALEQSINLTLAERQFVAARQRVQELIARNKPNSGLYLLLARVHTAENDAEAARAALLKVVELEPASALGHVMLARIDLSSAQPDKALENLNVAIEKDPKNVAALLLRASILDSRQDYAGARDGYEKLLAVQPNHAAALNNLAYLYSERFNDSEKAFKLAQQARQLQPNEPHVADTLGWIVFKRGQYAWAITLLTEAAAKLPTSADVLFHLGMAHYRLGEEQSARAALDRAVALGSDFPGVKQAREALQILAITPSKLSPDELALVQTAAAAGSDPVALSRLGAHHERNGNLDAAAEAFGAALQSSPRNITAALDVIRLHSRRGDAAKALELAKATRTLAPDHPEVAYVLATLAMATGDHRWAFSLLQDCARQRPEDAVTLFALAQAAYGLGNLAITQSSAQAALAANASFSGAGEARVLLEAIELTANPPPSLPVTFEKRLAKDPADVPALMALASIRTRAGDAIGASEAFTKILERYPEFAPAKRGLVLHFAAIAENTKKGLELAVGARAAFPNDSELAKATGILMYRDKNFTGARTLLQESAQARGSDAELLFYLGMAQHRLNDRTASQQTLASAIEKGLPAELAKEAKQVLGDSVTKR